MRFVVAAIAAGLVVLATAEAHADRPTSGDMSILSGRTLGNGETVFAAGGGWPGLWAHLELAPSSTFNLGIRAAFVYGSPIMGFGTGVGTELSVPMRIHVLGRGEWDLAIRIRPYVVVGKAGLVGADDSIFDDDFGWGLLAEAGLLAGYHPNDLLTLALGLVTGMGVVGVPDAEATELAGNVLAVVGLELLLDRDIMMLAELQAGGGFADVDAFDEKGAVRASLGAAFLF